MKSIIKSKMKNQMKNLLMASIVIMALMLGSCGEDVDPTKADVRLEMKATTQLNTINTSARVAESGVEFTDFLIGVTEIEFEGLEGSNSDDDHSGNDDSGNDSNDDSGHGSDDDDGHHEDEYEIEFEGQFIVNLLTGTSDPDFGIADVIPGVYKEIKLKMRPILDDGNSVFVRFNYTPDGQDQVTVEFSTNKEIEFELEKHSGIQLDGNSLNQVLILFDLDKLLANVDLSILDKDEDGVIRINGSSNSSVTAAILSNFHQSCEAGEDDDHDDKFDDDDHSDDD